MDNEKIYTRRTGSQTYKKTLETVETLNVYFKYRDDLLELQLNIVEKFLFRRSGVKGIGITCVQCGRNYDPYEMLCPVCARRFKEQCQAVDLENKHIKSLIKNIIGDIEL